MRCGEKERGYRKKGIQIVRGPRAVVEITCLSIHKIILIAMTANSETMHWFSLWFQTEDLERRFQESRRRYEDLPYLGRVLLWAIILVCSLRRVQLLFAAYFGFTKDDPTGELRLTLEYFAGLILEFCVYKRPTMVSLRGAISTFTTFWTIIDGSCIYYPVVPALMPL